MQSNLDGVNALNPTLERGGPAFYGPQAVARLLDLSGCTEAMRQAMAALSVDPKAQPLRQVIDLGGRHRLFGVMPGSLDAAGAFGAKLISVFPDETEGRTRHQGLVMAFDSASGRVECLADAETVTQIRTACASAAATDALARADAKVLSVYGLGVQAASHIKALSLVRPFERTLLWGRDFARAQARAAALSQALGTDVTAIADGREAAEQADVICTTTGASEPILMGAWVRKGAHVNLVGSSFLGPVEVDSDLVVKSRYIADYRPSVLAQGAELDVARRAGLVDDSHVVGDIGQVFCGTLVGREHPDQITVYKSLGHVVQDLAATVYLHARAQSQTPG